MRIMEEILLRKLVESNIVTKNTEIEAHHHHGLSFSETLCEQFSTLTIINILERKKSKKLVLECMAASTGYVVRVESENITSIDGMDPVRHAANYMIDAKGNDTNIVVKRRGRKRKGEE